MRLWLDPNRLAGRGLTASDVTNALREQNVQVAAGSVGAQPSSEDQMFQLSVRAAGRLTEVSEFEDIVVKAGQDGALVRVRDIGRVELGAEDYSSRLRFAGVEASGVGIMLLPTANALEVFSGVTAEMDRLDDQFPPGLKWQLAFDNVVVVRESIIEVLITLAEAIALVILVMFLFLQNWRSTLIPAITIPVSLIGTFAFVKLLGYSINTLTLFGIVLATGIVVDDAIVVIENIERHMREFGKSAHDAAVDAMREVFSAVVVIGIVLVAVFLPVAFFPGHDRSDVSAVRDDDHVRGDSVGVQRRHVYAGPGCAAARQGEPHARQVLHRREPRDRRRHEWIRARGRRRPPVEMGDGGRVRPVARRDVVGVSRRSRRVRAGRRRRLLHHHRAGAVGRVDRVHDEHHEGGRADLLQAAGDCGRVLRRRLQLQRGGIEQRADVHPIEGVRGTRGRGALARGGAESAARPGVRHPRRDGDSGRSPVDSGRLGVRRIPDGDPGSGRRRYQRAGAGHAADRGRGQSIRARRRTVLGVYRERPAARRRRSIATRHGRWACPSAR